MSPYITITQNRKARHQYEVLDTIECGISLIGCEVKSLRQFNCSLDGSYATITDNEVWLIGCHIDPHENRDQFIEYQPTRKRKLLLKKKQIRQFAEKSEQKGYTLIPLSLYLKNGRVKVELAVCKGKSLHDKRQSLSDKEAQKMLRDFGGKR